MKLNLKNRLKVLATGRVDEYIRAFLSGEDLPIEGAIDQETALKYSAVFGCCRVLGETFASAPLMLYKKEGKERIPVTEVEKADTRMTLLYDIMHNAPNDEMDAFNYHETTMFSLNLSGNAVCQKLFNRDGKFVGLYPIKPGAVKIERNKETNTLEYHLNDEKRTVLNRSDVLHVPGMSYDGVIGLSPISYAAGAIRLGMSYEKFGEMFYRNSANPSGAVETEHTLSEPAYKRLKEDLEKNHIGLRNTGAPIVLEDGLKWKQITINPIDAQLIESKYFSIEDICRIYRVPQHLLNKLDRSTNNNIEHQSLEFVMYTMLPNYKRFEGCENAQLIPRELRLQGYFFEHKMDGLLRGDSLSRANLYSKGRQWGWLSVNDIRRLENLPGIGPKGDVYLQPINMTELTNSAREAIKSLVAKEIEGVMKEAGR